MHPVTGGGNNRKNKVGLEQECWRAFDNSAQLLLIYSFDSRFGRILQQGFTGIVKTNNLFSRQ